MKSYEDFCCDCAVPGYPCLGDSCSRRNVLVITCDVCGEEIPEYDDGYDENEDYHVCSSCREREEEEDE